MLQKDTTAYIAQKSDEFKEKLLAKGFVTDGNFDEISYAKEQYFNRCRDKTHFTVTILPTTNCNLKCPYCFIARNGQAMKIETVELVKSYLKDLLEKNKESLREFHVKWFGGEPLLEKKTIADISKHIIALCDIYKIRYNAMVYTNLAHYAANDISFFKSNRISLINTTIDGHQSENDSRRPSKNGESTFQTIIDNIKVLREFANINIQTNIDQNNANSVKTLIQFFIENEIVDGKRVNLGFSFVNDNQFIENKKCLVSFSDIKFMKIINEYYKLLGEKCTIELPKAKGVPCFSIATNTLVIDSLGKLYKCYHDPAKSISIGSIEDKYEKSELDFDQSKNNYSERLKKCSACNLFPICMGGCPDLVEEENICSMKYLLPFKLERYLNRKMVAYE